MTLIDLSQDSDDDDLNKIADGNRLASSCQNNTCSTMINPQGVKMEARPEDDHTEPGWCKACESLYIRDPSLRQKMSHAKRTFLSDMNNIFLRCLSWMRRHMIRIECGDKTTTLLTCFPFLSSSFSSSTVGTKSVC